MKVLVVGAGGREHAIVWKLTQSVKVEEVYCAPGNGGISKICTCVPIETLNIEEMVAFAKEKSVDLVVVAPDDPLAAGMVDAFEGEGIRAFGPNKRAALIEASKAFSKQLMKKYNIPTAQYETYDNKEQALEYLKNCKYPIVIKADGLALGKGVFITQNFYEAKDAIQSIMSDRAFGDAGNTVVIEEFLVGKEVSLLAFTDGKNIIPMVSSQDYKKAFDNDEGPNTGGMGTFSPSKIYDEKMQKYCMEKIFIPTIEAMRNEGRNFKGVLYFGLIITAQGPKVLEYNARFGDPETQVVLPRLKTDLVDIFEAVIDERLSSIEIEWNEKSAVCIVITSCGYPNKYETGFQISGIESFNESDDVIVFHGGTKLEDGHFLTKGGRVLGITALGSSHELARQIAYDAVSKITFKNSYFRKDIGL